MNRWNPCTDVRPTETCVAPVDASRDLFIYLFSERAVCVGGGGGGGSSPPPLFSRSGHGRDWPPPCTVVSFGLATNTLNDVTILLVVL